MGHLELNQQSHAAQPDRPLRNRWLDHLSSLSDDDFSLGCQPTGRPAGLLHEFFPVLRIQQASRLGGTNGFAGGTTGKELDDRRLEGTVHICQLGYFFHSEPSSGITRSASLQSMSQVLSSLEMMAKENPAPTRRRIRRAVCFSSCGFARRLDRKSVV